MNVQLQKPDLERYINEQVSAGNFPSPEAVVEDALQYRMMIDEPVELTEEDIAAIKEADEEFARGEGIDAETAKAQIRKLYRKAGS